MNLSSFYAILLNHAARYPAWQPQDVYKLAHQAALGSEHAVIDRERACAWLEEEITGLTSPELNPTDEPLVDPISVDGSVARVHLRPLVRLDLPPDLLLEAFLRTAAEFRGDIDRLEEYLSTAGALAASGKLGMDAKPLAELVAEMRSTGFPAAHHSETYTRAYHPAYRVVLLATLPEVFSRGGSAYFASPNGL